MKKCAIPLHASLDTCPPTNLLEHFTLRNYKHYYEHIWTILWPLTHLRTAKFSSKLRVQWSLWGNPSREQKSYIAPFYDMTLWLESQYLAIRGQMRLPSNILKALTGLFHWSIHCLLGTWPEMHCNTEQHNSCDVRMNRPEKLSQYRKKERENNITQIKQ